MSRYSVRKQLTTLLLSVCYDDIVQLILHYCYPKSLYITYRVTGTDHCGYCSGAEGDDIEPYETSECCLNENYIPYSQFDMDGYFISDNLEKFNYTNWGCTSGGSGYCENCQQEYQAISVELVEPNVNE